MQNLILESAARAILIAISMAAVLFILRVKTARVRHAVWAAVVVCMLALPVWTAWGPKAVWRVTQPAPTPVATQSQSLSASILNQAEPPARDARWTWGYTLGTLYLAGFLALLARLAVGTLRARMLVHRAANRDGRLTSDSCAVPITIGLLKPTVILPASWQRWPEAQLNAVLTHEGEHARRRDPLVQWMALLNRAIFWFHPLAWWLERRLSSLAEQACDAAVLERGHDPVQYSEYLLDLARTVQQTGARVNVLGMAMPGKFLPQRIRQILENRPAPPMSRLRIACVAVACAAISTVFLAGGVRNTQSVASSQPAATPSFAAKPALPEPAAPTTSHKKTIPLIAQTQTRPTTRNPPSSTADEGSVSGTVEDPSGARIPAKCIITARNASGASVVVSHTDEAGSYRLSLPAGRYTLQFGAPGFALLNLNVDIGSAKPARLDAKLDLGAANEHITVTAPKLDTMAPTSPTSRTPVRIPVGGNVEPARLLQRSNPAYPTELQQQGVEGTVLIRTVISRDGTPLNPHVLNTEIDPRFANAALDSVRQWRYQPSLLNGQPVETAVTVTVEFRLK